MRILASLFAIIVIAGAFIFGFFVLIAGLVLGLAGWIVLSIRGWWLRRKGGAEPANPPPGQTEIIEAEYTVISRRRD